MVTHMKTTVDIAASLFEEARRTAARERVTVRELIESGLRREVRERNRKSGFRLRDSRFRGRGLRPELQGASWDAIRDLIYEGRGS